MNKVPMTLKLAQNFLGTCNRYELTQDESKELVWSLDGKEVASGFFRHVSGEISVNETDQFTETLFKDGDADALEHIGKPASCVKNDAGDPMRKTDYSNPEEW